MPLLNEVQQAISTMQKKRKDDELAAMIQQATDPRTITGKTTRYTGENDPFPEEYLPSNYQGKDVIYETNADSYKDPFFEGSTNPVYTNLPGKVADEGVQQMWHTPSETVTPDMSNPDTLFRKYRS